MGIDWVWWGIWMNRFVIGWGKINNTIKAEDENGRRVVVEFLAERGIVHGLYIIHIQGLADFEMEWK